MKARLNNRNQVTIPKAIREELHLQPGSQVKLFHTPDGNVVILPMRPTSSLQGTLPKRSRPVTVEEMNAAARPR